MALGRMSLSQHQCSPGAKEIFIIWFSKYLQRLRRFLNHGHPTGQARKTARPQLEQLEDRLQPAIFFAPTAGIEHTEWPIPVGPVLPSAPVEVIFWGGDAWDNG